MLSPQLMLKELREAGLSQAEIAKRVGTSQPTVCRIMSGAATNYEFGKKIEALHASAVKPLSKTA